VAVAYIEGVQERGIGACIKHFVCNDQEHERHTISVEVDERTLREIYLPPFEAAVRRAGVWSAMGAYNRLRGTYCCEHPYLLQQVLKQEWAFDGVVMSDWFATHSAASVSAGLDLEMPGPHKYLGAALVDAVARDEVSRDAVMAAAGRVLRLIERSASGDAPAPGEPASDVARAAAAEAIVLLQNANVLPLQPGRLQRVAVIGPQSDRLAVQGGGSAEVSPTYVVSPLQAIRHRAGSEIQVTYEPGCALPGPTPVLDHCLRTGAGEGARGVVGGVGGAVGSGPQAVRSRNPATPSAPNIQRHCRIVACSTPKAWAIRALGHPSSDSKIARARSASPRRVEPASPRSSATCSAPAPTRERSPMANPICCANHARFCHMSTRQGNPA